jgi:hypothetical protein
MAIFKNTPPIVTNGLVLCLDAANKVSYPGTGSIWRDLAFKKYNATVSNGTLFNDTNNGVFTFNGTTNKVDVIRTNNQDVTPLPVGTQQYSLEAFWRSTSFKDQVIYEQESFFGGNGRRSSMFLRSNGQAGFVGAGADYTGASYNINTWYHWVINIDTTLGSNQIKIYINGLLAAQGNPTPFGLNIGGGYAGLGYSTLFNNSYFSGDIAAVRVYNRLLTEQEIQQNYNATKTRFGL